MFKKLLIVLVVFVVLGLMWGADSTYTREAVIVKSDNNTITCEDNGGNIWRYEGKGIVGEKITLVMHDNHTSKITDDIVTGIK